MINDPLRTRGPGFESSRWQLLLNNYLLLTVCRKYENKEKETENSPFSKNYVSGDRFWVVGYPLA